MNYQQLRAVRGAQKCLTSNIRSCNRESERVTSDLMTARPSLFEHIHNAAGGWIQEEISCRGLAGLRAAPHNRSGRFRRAVPGF